MNINFDKSRNPMLRNKSLAKTETLENRTGGPFIGSASQMTVSGAVNKTFVLVFITLLSFYFGYTSPSQLFLYGSMGLGAILFMFTSMKPHLAPITAPIYAVLKGIFIGTASVIYASMYDGIIFQAASLTIGTLLTMLLIYKSGLIKVTKTFRTVVSLAVGSIMLVYLVQFIGVFVGFNIPFVFDGGPISIGICIVILGVAAMNLLLDFYNFDTGEKMGAPKYMEWYYGMALLFTLVWLYIEFLRLLSYLQRD